jgi:hypothetical protein
MIKKTLLYREFFLYLFITIALLCWFDWQAFFWRDDWVFIDDYLNKNFLDFIFTAYNGHVKPLFKLVYYSQLLFFGKNALFFQMTNVVFFGLLAYIFSLILREVSFKENKSFAIYTAVLMCAHPGFGSITLWIFAICIILQLLFQALAILFYFKFIKDNTTPQNYFLFILFVIVQNYFFGNGLFFPLLFIFHQFLENRFKINKPIIILLTIQLLFVLIQNFSSNQSIGIHYIFQNNIEILKSFFTLLFISSARFFFIKQEINSVLICASTLIFLWVCYWSLKKNKNMFLFGFVYLILASVSIPIARLGLTKSFSYYYSVLLFPAFFFLFYTAISSFNLKYIKPIVLTGSIVLFSYFVLDVQVKRIYSYRNFKNKENLLNAIHYSKEHYYPFDDPFITDSKNICIDNFKNIGIQNSLGKNNYFEMDSIIRNYLGRSSAAVFNEMSNNVIRNYKLLSKESKVDIDLNYEKQ